VVVAVHPLIPVDRVTAEPITVAATVAVDLHSHCCSSLSLITGTFVTEEVSASCDLWQMNCGDVVSAAAAVSLPEVRTIALPSTEASLFVIR
jgi:hypothetical protein